jgi:hypothetical protein
LLISNQGLGARFALSRLSVDELIIMCLVNVRMH